MPWFFPFGFAQESGRGRSCCESALAFVCAGENLLRRCLPLGAGASRSTCPGVRGDLRRGDAYTWKGMAGLRRDRWGAGSRRCAVGVVGLFAVAALPGSARAKVQLTARSAAQEQRHTGTQGREKDPWLAAVAARRSFEAEPEGEHTRAEFAQVMDNFRAIYHADPANLHAPRAVDQVAELLAEQGQQLRDAKSLRAAAGQYEFLASAYPQSSLAAPALGHALALLGPEGVNDPAEARRVRGLLRQGYPRSAAAVGGEPSGSGGTVAEHRFPTGMTAGKTTDAQGGLSGAEVVQEAEGAAPAVVSGIRHWSTATYTRVAIDLGGEVQFQAARVENPDRIFFDLHGAKLATGLAGKSFAITDDGFLTTIRAAQSGPDVTRIMLDVQPVAEYSAFLLPNPYRLIIDIHGRPAGEMVASGAGGQKQATRQASPVPADENAAEQPPAPVTRVSPVTPGTEVAGGAGSGSGSGSGSTLPPMPVTDGSASFGLPAKRTVKPPANPAGTAGATTAKPAPQPVAQPRVVVSSKPTVAKPVPNSVTSAAPEGNREVAAVSEGPGVIAATDGPTSKPVVDRAKGRAQGGGHKAQGAAATPAGPAAPVEPPPLTAAGQSTLMRALGLKIGRIVIDAGHGGHDSGTLGPDGIEEKDVVLDVALRLGKLLHDRLGAEVVYTRADDTFIPLETRTAIANKAQADLFISVHANSSQDPSARGVEVYYLNFTSDPEAMQVASRENAVSSQRVNQLSDLVKKIALKDKIDESREVATDVDASLYAGLRKGNAGLKDRGVKKAPFVVLIGANMPSILAEISFVTNPDDAAKLSEPAYRERVAESLYSGVARYAGSINGPAGKGRGPEQTARAE